MSGEQLQELVQASDHARIRAFFKGMPEGKRKAYAKLARELFGATGHMRVEYIDPNWSDEGKERNAKRSDYQSNRKVAAFSALVACCPVSAVRAAHRDMNLMECIEYVSTETDSPPVSILADRAPAWSQSYLEWLIKQSERTWWTVSWTYLWRLVKHGVCERPQSPEYYRLFAGAGWTWMGRQRGTTLLDFMLRHASEVESEIWSLFTIDETVHGNEWGLVEGTWFTVLPKLAENGLLSRERLLQESLHALNRDFREVQLRWYSKFHEILAPTVDERAALEAEYRALLSNKVRTTVKLAVDALTEINKSRELDVLALAEAIKPLLAVSTKGVAVAALALLKSVAAKHPELRTEVSFAAASALAHSAADINERALKLILTLAEPDDPATSAAVRTYADHTAPSVRSKMAAWLGESLASPAAHPTVDVSDLRRRAEALPPRLLALAGLSVEPDGFVSRPLAFRRLLVPCLDPTARIEPIRDLDELVEVAMRQLVEPEDADELERIYDGVARLGSQRPRHFSDLTGQLLKQVTGRSFMWADDVADAMQTLLRCWLIYDIVPCESEPGPYLARFLQERVGHISHRFTSGIEQGLLSCPTHRGGWIDPRVLVERALGIQVAGSASDRIDWVLALLRLAPDSRDEALRDAAGVSGEEGAALRYALGGPFEGATHSAWIWAAASRARDPDARDEEVRRTFPQLAGEQVFPDTFKPVVEVRRVRYGMEECIVLDVEASSAMPEGRDPAHFAMLYQSSGRRGRHVYSTVTGLALGMRWLASAWPMRREPYCALAASELGSNLDWIERYWENRAWYEPLLDPDCEMGEMAQLLLAVGLASKQQTECGLATDILIAAIADGRIEGDALGACMGRLLFTGLIKPPRWARTLAEAARVSPLHGREVHGALARALADGMGSPLRGLHTLLELLYQLSVEAGTPVTNERALAYLEGLKGSSKLAKAAKALLAFRPDSASGAAAEAEAAALLGRVERAERWNRWSTGVSHGQQG